MQAIQAALKQNIAHKQAIAGDTLQKQRALRAVQQAVVETRKYLSKGSASANDLVVEAEIAEQWAHAASCLGGVGEWSLAHKCLDSVRFWQQRNPYV